MTPAKPTTPFSVCVYCGSRHGAEPAYTDAARALGSFIGSQGWQMVYGGGKVGLMGEAADSALAAGGRVVGVIPMSLQKMEVGHTGLSELHVVETMHQRKQLMAERSHAFIAMPGGIGTLEELFEVWTWRQLGYHRSPIGLLNTNGYYDELLRFMDHTVAQGFLSAEQRNNLIVGTQPQTLLQSLHETWASQAPARADFEKV